MSNPSIKVGADLGAVTSGITAVGASAEKANKAAQKSLQAARRELQGYVGDVEKARRAFEALQKSGARGTRALKSQSFDDYMGGGWRDSSVNDAEASRMHRAVLARVGLQQPGGPGGQGALGFGGHSLYLAGRGVMNAAFPVGGVGASIAASGFAAAKAGPGGLMSGAGLARLALGGGIGAAAFGAIKGVQAIGAKVGQAEHESLNYADLLRQVGGKSSEFGALRDSVRGSTAGLGLSYDESVKLAAEYANQAGTKPGDRGAVAGKVGQAVQFSRALGLNPEQGNGFFAGMEKSGVTRSEADARKLGQVIGDVIADKGGFARAGELLEEIKGFAASTAARSYTTANVGAYVGAAGRYAGLGLPGMGLSEGAGLASRLDAGFRSGGGGGPRDEFMLSVLQRASGNNANAYDLDTMKAGGMFGTGSKVFGHDSLQYRAAEKMGNTKETDRLDAVAKTTGGKTMGDLVTQALLDFYKGNTQAVVSALATTFGVSNSDAAAHVMGYLTPGGSSGGKFDAAPAQTEGDKNRASIASLGNVFSEFATKAIPLLTAVRDGVVSAAEFLGVLPKGTLAKMKASEAAAAGHVEGGAGGSWAGAGPTNALVTGGEKAPTAPGQWMHNLVGQPMLTEADQRKAAGFSPAELARQNAEMGSPESLAELQQAIKDESNPRKRMALRETLDYYQGMGGQGAGSVASAAAPSGGAGGPISVQVSGNFQVLNETGRVVSRLNTSGSAPVPAGARR